MTDTFVRSDPKLVARRNRSERRFRAYGIGALALTGFFLAFLLADIVFKGWPAFIEHKVLLPLKLDAAGFSVAEPLKGDYDTAVREAFRVLFPDATSRRDRKKLLALLSVGAAEDLREMVAADPSLIGRDLKVPVLLSADADLYLKGTKTGVDEKQVAWLEDLKSNGRIESALAWRFFLSGDSREPELAGIRGALTGSLLTVFVALALSLPLGVAAAVYLEEFAPRNRFTDLIEVNINNLAAVPSIIFGLLGLAVFLNFFGLPRSAALAGGLVLALLVLPTIIIASRAALAAVPPSIKEAALGVGASHQQAVFHHVLPLALPGILTGTILGVARALGETAPLLMIGMVAFIVDVPHGFTDAATVLPVQIFLWADLPEIAFQSRTAAAIIVLMVVLIALNAVAIFLRRRFERRW